MSADNTILIARLPNSEYRVAEITNYEEFFDDGIMSEEEVDMKRTYYFIDAPVFMNEYDASEYAGKLEDESGYVEYGICTADFNRPLLKMTREEVGKWWDEKYNI